METLFAASAKMATPIPGSETYRVDVAEVAAKLALVNGLVPSGELLSARLQPQRQWAGKPRGTASTTSSVEFISHAAAPARSPTLMRDRRHRLTSAYADRAPERNFRDGGARRSGADCKILPVAALSATLFRIQRLKSWPANSFSILCPSWSFLILLSFLSFGLYASY